jgi:hypothetical protein
MSGAPPAPSASSDMAAPTLIDSIWLSIVTPGAGPGLVLAVNAALGALLLALAYFAATGLGDAHVAALAALAVGLLASFNWFVAVAEAAEAKAAPRAKEE